MPPAPERHSRPDGFSLLEMLVVMSIIVTVLALSSLGLQGFNRDRQGALAELRGVLDGARAQALAQGTDVYVAFATDGPSDPEDRFRRFAVFVPEAPDLPDANVFTRPLLAASEWHALPEGILFAVGAEFETVPGHDLATILEAPPEFRRKFDFGPDHTPQQPVRELEMPFFLFNAQGLLELPPVYAERFHHVGVVEAATQPGASSRGIPNRMHLGWQDAVAGGGRVPRTACLAVHAATGRALSLSPP
jgi:prepilin-type N-terminal cleavage/methylation domain-containing protein